MTISDLSSHIAKRVHNFVGREWAFPEIDRWLADPNGLCYLIIAGETGVGKTTAVRLTEVSKGYVPSPDGFQLVTLDLSAYHFSAAFPFLSACIVYCC
jgi:flagellar biosynthesis GTPase FlhF